MPKPVTDLHLSAPKIFKRTSFETIDSKKLDPKIKKGVNYIIGQIALYWPSGDENVVRAANLSLMMGHSFYYGQFRPHLERLKNLELQGKSYMPFNIQADGVSLANHVLTSKVLLVHGTMALLISGTRHVPTITTTSLFITNSPLVIA